MDDTFEIRDNERIVSVTQEHIDSAIRDRNFNSTPTMLALREAGLDSSCGIEPSYDGGILVYIYTNEKKQHPRYKVDEDGYFHDSCMDSKGLMAYGYIIRQKLNNWMEHYCHNWYCNPKSIKPMDIVLTKGDEYWYADIKD